MKRRLLAIGALFLLTVGAAACRGKAVTPTPTGRERNPSTPTAVTHDGPVQDYSSLVDSLRAGGATVEPAGQVSQPFLSVQGQLISLNTEVVQVYEYPDATTPDGDATSISSGAIESVIDWVATPHFFRTGRLLVLYVGDSTAVINALEAVLGPQFAGGSTPGLDTVPATYDGIALPGGGDTITEDAPPLAWLVSGGTAVPATQGSYTVSYPDESAPRGDNGEVVRTVVHADAILPETNPDLATATVAADEHVVVVIASDAIGSFTATLADWTDLYGPSQRTLQAERASAGSLTAFTLEPAGDAGDRLLTISITFDQGGCELLLAAQPWTSCHAGSHITD